MRPGRWPVAALLLPASAAWAVGRGELEIGASMGIFLPSAEHELYDPYTAHHHRLSPGPVLGLRAAYQPLPVFGTELELDLGPSWARDASGALVWGWHGRGFLTSPRRLLPRGLEPALVAGIGLLGVASHTDTLGTDVDAAFHWGLCLEAALSDRLQLVLDGRHLLSSRLGPAALPASHFQALIGLSWVFTAGERRRIDRDNDGLLDEVDPCPKQAETPNGYLDDDGCPDQLATLGVVVRVAGEVRPGAEITVFGRQGVIRLHSTEAAVTTQLPPGRYKVHSTIPGYRGEQWVVVERVAEVVLDLAVVEPAFATVVARDELGVPVPGAEVKVVPQEAPHAEPVLVAPASSTLELPPGAYTIFVSAPGHAPYREDMELVPAERMVVYAVMGAPKVQLTTAALQITEAVHFEAGATGISPEDLPLLDEVAVVLLTHPELDRLEVIGHADSHEAWEDGALSDQEAQARSLQLSIGRAEAVRDHLIHRGVVGTRLLTSGFGEDLPVAPNSTPEGRAANRRVEFRVAER